MQIDDIKILQYNFIPQSLTKISHRALFRFHLHFGIFCQCRLLLATQNTFSFLYLTVNARVLLASPMCVYIHIYATHIDGVFMYCCMCVRGSQFPVMLPHQFKTQLTPVTLTQLQHAITYYCLPPAYQVDCCPPARSRPVDMESGVVLLFYTRREAICIFMHAAFSYKAW